MASPTTPHWLLNEHVVLGGQLAGHYVTGPTLLERLCVSKVTTLGLIVKLASPELDHTSTLGAKFRVTSSWVHWAAAGQLETSVDCG